MPKTATSVVPVNGADVAEGDRLWTENGFTSEITHFVTPPPESFACAMYGQGVRIPFHGDQPIMWPIAPDALVGIQAREAA